MDNIVDGIIAISGLVAAFGLGWVTGLLTPPAISINIKFDYRTYQSKSDNGYKIDAEHNSSDESCSDEDADEENDILRGVSNPENSKNPENSVSERTRVPFDEHAIIPLVSSEDDPSEIDRLFQDACAREPETIETTLEKGVSKGSQPVSFLTSTSGGYATNETLQSIGDKHRNFTPLSKRDELDIIHTFETICGMHYTNAMAIVKQKGYKLHPIEVIISGGLVQQLSQYPQYDASVLGVRIRDANYAGGIPSPTATVSQIINVGGVYHLRK